jgi:phosphatidylglycerol---prolipoprotein diacylglyceryl transferase
MYPNIYYVFKSWFGVEWKSLSFLNTFGLMVALGFVSAAVVLNYELQRKEKQGLLFPREEMIAVGKPASIIELLINGLVGFIFGYKLIGLFFSKPDAVNPQEYIFSAQGNLLGGIAFAAVLAGLKWWDKNKQKLKQPENRSIRIWPHDRVGDIIILGLIFGILGAKLFDNLENWSDFVKDPIGRLFSASGLTFYGGLIVAAIAIMIYAKKRGIKIIHLVDAAAPALMIAYAVGRIGCQVAGDGDWGVYNSAYIADVNGKAVLAKPGEFKKQLEKNAAYFLEGRAIDGDSVSTYVTDRKYDSLSLVPTKYFVAPSFLPTWMVAYTFPQNVNKDGVLLPNITDEHNRALPLPVFPTPFYETVMCTVLFLVLWAIRKKVKVPGVIFGIYLMLNGLERFTVELIRVNNTYAISGFKPTQAEIIAVALAIIGLVLIVFANKKNKVVDI